MAESQQEDEDLVTPGYKAPAQKSIAEIASQDAEDESLRRYKEALLGNVAAIKGDPSDPRKVILEKLSVVVEGREDITLDLTDTLTKFKETPIVIKEGTDYKLKIEFRCPREIVAGLKFHTTVQRKGIKVDTLSYMVGSYGPNTTEKPHIYTNPVAETAPSGALARGKYTAKSKFLDDDKVIHLQWEWSLDIKKRWPEEKE